MSVMSSLQAWYEEQSLAGSLPSSSLVNGTASSKSSSEPSPPLPPPSSSASSYELIVKAVGKGTGMTAMQAERFVSFSAFTGTAYVAMRMYMYAYNILRGDDKSEVEESDNSTPIDPISPRQTRRVSHSILGVFRRTLRKILLDESEYIARAPSAIKGDKAKAKEDLEDALVTHQGSCHCESIQFTIVAPRVIRAQDGPGKIHFRHVSVKAADFQVYAGFENMKTYYVAYQDSGDKGAHAFCERCGVHVLYAPSKSSPNVSINVRCLRDDESRKIKIISKKDGISNGIPVAEQFDHQIIPDHLSTVSEVTQPFHFQMNNRQPSYAMPRQDFVSRNKSDVSSIASPTSDEDLSLGIPIKQFYAPTTSGKNSRRSTFSAGTASLTDQSSGSLYRGSVGSGRHSMLPPMSPARSNARSFGGIDEYSYTGESVSLMDDSMSLNSARNHSVISLREKDATLRANNRTGGENLNAAGNAPLHPTVDRNKMKRFMSKYKKNKKVESSS